MRGANAPPPEAQSQEFSHPNLGKVTCRHADADGARRQLSAATLDQTNGREGRLHPRGLGPLLIHHQPPKKNLFLFSPGGGAAGRSCSPESGRLAVSIKVKMCKNDRRDHDHASSCFKEEKNGACEVTCCLLRLKASNRCHEAHGGVPPSVSRRKR